MNQFGGGLGEDGIDFSKLGGGGGDMPGMEGLGAGEEGGDDEEGEDDDEMPDLEEDKEEEGDAKGKGKEAA